MTTKRDNPNPNARQRGGAEAVRHPMRAVVRDAYGSADRLEVREVERPAVAGDEVLVRVHAAGLTRGDWHVMTGRPYLLRLAGFGVRRPKMATLGSDLAGVVEITGAEVRDWAPGDAVFGIGRGSFADYAIARPEKLARMPANLTFEQASAVPVSGLTALQALRDKGRVQKGQHVLVIGASGGVGTFAVQIAKAFGAEVTGVCSTAKTGLVRSAGADHVIDYAVSDIGEGHARYDVVLDIAGNRPLAALRRVLTATGTLVIVGGEGGGQWFGGIDRQLRATALSPFVGQRLGTLLASENGTDLEALRALVEDGAVTPVIDRVCTLAEIPDALRDLEAGRVRGKVVAAV